MKPHYRLRKKSVENDWGLGNVTKCCENFLSSVFRVSSGTDLDDCAKPMTPVSSCRHLVAPIMPDIYCVAARKASFTLPLHRSVCPKCARTSSLTAGQSWRMATDCSQRTLTSRNSQGTRVSAHSARAMRAQRRKKSSPSEIVPLRLTGQDGQ